MWSVQYWTIELSRRAFLLIDLISVAAVNLITYLRVCTFLHTKYPNIKEIFLRKKVKYFFFKEKSVRFKNLSIKAWHIIFPLHSKKYFHTNLYFGLILLAMSECDSESSPGAARNKRQKIYKWRHLYSNRLCACSMGVTCPVLPSPVECTCTCTTFVTFVSRAPAEQEYVWESAQSKPHSAATAAGFTFGRRA